MMGWEYRKKEKRKSDIIFIYNTMPRISGVEATRILRERGSIVPIIGIIGYSLEDDCKLFVEAGADVVFVKPITPCVLAKVKQKIKLLLKCRSKCTANVLPMKGACTISNIHTFADISSNTTSV